jgi:hypothetical protein
VVIPAKHTFCPGSSRTREAAEGRTGTSEVATQEPDSDRPSLRIKTYHLLLLLVPISLFISSLCIPPRVNWDAGEGFRVLQSMLGGAAFNTVIAPDPGNIAQDVSTFQTWWSPGQYLAPGSFVWLGLNYGVALSLTTVVATLIGVLGWIQLSRSFAVSSFVLFIFVLGLSTFSYITLFFLEYSGGEPLLFAIAPWSLYIMRWSASKSSILCLALSCASLALLFFAKLTGIIIFASNVVAITLVFVICRRRFTSPIIAMWIASVIGVLCLSMFWLARGWVPANGTKFGFYWFPIWFSISGAAFSGISGLDLLLAILGGTPWWQIPPGQQANELIIYALGPLGLVVMAWVWLSLRHTPYREMAILLLAVILSYAIAIAALYCRGAWVSFEERHFRYAGILFFLLVLTAVDQRRAPWAKGLVFVAVVVLGLYGLKQYISGAYAQVQRGYYDPLTGISQDVSPTVLKYMRSEVERHHFQRPVAVVPLPVAAMSLPQFRIIVIAGQLLPLEKITALKFAGRAEKIFVILPEEIRGTDKAEAVLRSFTGYEFDSWRQMNAGGMIIYTQ